MLKSIKREFLLNRNSLWQSLAVLGGAWLLGEALSLCIMYVAHEEEYFSLNDLIMRMPSRLLVETITGKN